MSAAKYTILVREGKNWKQFMVITDNEVSIVHMVPAMFGWNIGLIERQGDAEWCGMSHAAIVAWKMINDDGLTRVADLDPTFRDKLISRVEGTS